MSSVACFIVPTMVIPISYQYLLLKVAVTVVLIGLCCVLNSCRAKYIAKTAQIVHNEKPVGWLEGLKELPYKECVAELMQLCGVGRKVSFNIIISLH